MSANETVIIVGAGHAAGELATSLRGNGWKGHIVLIGEEPHLPYQRPALSKGYLAGDVPLTSLYLKPQATYDMASVQMISGRRVESIDRPRKSVTLSDGQIMPYSKLVLTVGGRPRKMSLAGSEIIEHNHNLHYLRNIGDVMGIRPQFQPGMRLVIVGGGYIGLEVAAVAVKCGLRVTVLEALPRVLARVTAPEISAFYARVHREEGVDLRTGVEVASFELNVSGDALAAVHCTDGSRLAADLVVVGIGLLPNIELARDAGLEIDNGIVVDEFARTADHDVLAAGDCTNHPCAILGRRLRLESVPNAVEQARTAAATLCGNPRPYAAVPWFWSDQYDLKLKMVGLSQGYDRLVLRGSTSSRSFSAFYLKAGHVIAADTVNRPQEFMIAKRFVTERSIADPAVLADESLELKNLLSKI